MLPVYTPLGQLLKYLLFSPLTCLLVNHFPLAQSQPVAHFHPLNAMYINLLLQISFAPSCCVIAPNTLLFYILISWLRLPAKRKKRSVPLHNWLIGYLITINHMRNPMFLNYPPVSESAPTAMSSVVPHLVASFTSRFVQLYKVCDHNVMCLC